MPFCCRSDLLFPLRGKLFSGLSMRAPRSQWVPAIPVAERRLKARPALLWRETRSANSGGRDRSGLITARMRSSSRCRCILACSMNSARSGKRTKAADKWPCLPQPVWQALFGHTQGEDPRRQPDQEPARGRLHARGDRGFPPSMTGGITGHPTT